MKHYLLSVITPTGGEPPVGEEMARIGRNLETEPGRAGPPRPAPARTDPLIRHGHPAILVRPPADPGTAAERPVVHTLSASRTDRSASRPPSPDEVTRPASST